MRAVRGKCFVAVFVSSVRSHHDVASQGRLSTYVVSVFFRFSFERVFIYQWGDVFWSMEVSATTRWQRAFNLELMNECSHDWTARCPELFLERHPGGRRISRRWFYVFLSSDSATNLFFYDHAVILSISEYSLRECLTVALYTKIITDFLWIIIRLKKYI